LDLFPRQDPADLGHYGKTAFLVYSNHHIYLCLDRTGYGHD
jgi:hypothetical protein